MGDSAAERVAALLLAFENPGRAGGEHSVSELARSVGRERSQVSRMLKALSRSGLVEQDPDRRTYRLGWNLRILSTGAGNYPLVQATRPALQALVAKTGEVALLSVQEGNRSLTVLREESQQSLQAGGWVGRRSPMHCTASGRALMFDFDEELIETLTTDDLKIPTSAPGAPKDLASLLQRVHLERIRGYSVASEEVEIGLTSVAAPVRDRLGHIAGVLNISAPTSRIITKTDSIGQLLINASRAITQNLGSRRT
ncbi:IclR family transcriptional regulator [Arthrobacter cupressi]|uniref:Transcriptional regulator, IclR family n=1 Tax=Arthrobacter cupressi TaxID=1045773 RepID=A0A1G8SRH7_9MICC|nr:IclR family transcriptional regulator [Arthrobacter cupressi]NYD78421.1 DNA-binding IclR family transcriptional regulator [Arthrobacter cupressi]SDJ31868.1 transcriptional regulator, IclR family [Arthrobacter cupressi]